jgi:hypothetical protein
MRGCVVAYNTQLRKMRSITKKFFFTEKDLCKKLSNFVLCTKMLQMLLVGNPSSFFYKEKKIEPVTWNLLDNQD